MRTRGTLLASVLMFLFTFGLGFGAASCTHAPPNLTPVATSDFNKHRVIDILDVVRNAAVSGERTTPQMVSTDTMLKVVRLHRSLLVTIDATNSGWKTAVGTGLDQLLTDLPPNEAALLRPYVNLVKTVIQEIN